MKLSITVLLAAMSLTLNAAAESEATYDLSGGDVCVLQIMKEGSPSLVIACGGQTMVNNPIQAYSEMKNAVVFQSESKKIFLSRLAPTTGYQCSEYDNTTAYLLLCKSP